MVSETVSQVSERQLNVTVSRIDDNESGTEGPSDKGLANAEQLLERCAGVSGEVRARRAVTEPGFAVPLSRRPGEPAPVPT